MANHTNGSLKHWGEMVTELDSVLGFKGKMSVYSHSLCSAEKPGQLSCHPRDMPTPGANSLAILGLIDPGAFR